ncbi:MAG: hypothetical protein SVY53_09855 [Chloroflexota bacterium]|nr:hypothetical protein [Chloroflexota bacterium]
MQNVIIIIASVGSGLIVLLVILRLLFTAARIRLSRVVDKHVTGQEVLLQTLRANSFGQSSRGARQIRGNGALILTAQELTFIMFLPRRITSIPVCNIASVTKAKRHLGKSTIRPLLRVDFQSSNGDDSIAWSVDHLDEWRNAIETARYHIRSQ